MPRNILNKRTKVINPLVAIQGKEKKMKVLKVLLKIVRFLKNKQVQIFLISSLECK